jgi:hypothetical protein
MELMDNLYFIEDTNIYVQYIQHIHLVCIRQARSLYVLHTNMTSVLVVQCWGSHVYVLKQPQTMFSNVIMHKLYLYNSKVYI